jgi:transketolase
MRQTALQTVYELARTDSRIVFIGSDLGYGTLVDMKKELPNQFFMEGISEQHIVGFAAGLAKQGFIPFVNTIATFFSRRAYEQIAIDLALHQSKVILLASGGGMVYAPLGPTHTAIEDIAAMSAIPGIQIACPADPIEMREIIIASSREAGPWYVRFGKGGEPLIVDQYREKTGFIKLFGQSNSPILILTTGIMLHVAMEFKSKSKKFGYQICIVHVPVLQELESEILVKLLKTAKRVIVLEEHIPVGGLFTRLLHVAHQKGIDSRKFRHRSLMHEFSHHYGTQKDHLEYNKLSESGILECLEDLKL